MKKADWVWMPHPGHLVVSRDCKFHLNTYVGGYIVSTVGEYLPDSQVREILAKSRGIELSGRWLKKNDWEEIGSGRKYETMVFPAKIAEDKCCPFFAYDWSTLDFDGYNDAGEAFAGHQKMCKKWASKREQHDPRKEQ